MIKFEKSTLNAEMVRGDTGTFSVSPKIEGKAILKKGDELYFTLKKLQTKDMILQKKITDFVDGVATITIEPKDTKNLEPDNYIYDLKLIRADGSVDTLIPNAPYAFFSLKKGVKDNG